MLKRFFYSLLIEGFLAPFIFLFIVIQLYFRNVKFPAYRKRNAERFGHYPFSLKQSIWIHAVSGGEVITIAPIIEQCLRDYPGRPVLVTTMTPTGAMQVERLFAKRVHHVFVPYDVTMFVSRFLKAMEPSIAIFVETEIWPTLLSECKRRGIPTLLLNARLSEKSFKRYKRVKWLMQDTFHAFTHLAVQTPVEVERFHALGVPLQHMTVTGSLKCDVERTASLFEEAAQLRNQLGSDRFVWIAASTHQGEEEIILAAHQRIVEQIPTALLILVPKHPDRFVSVATLAARHGVIALRSKKEWPTQAISIYVGDTLGELVLLYAAADVAFVGGSFIPQGGHNLLEPASVGKPVLSGHHLHNFHAISQWLLEAKALTLVDDAESLAQAVLYLAVHSEERKEQGVRARAVCDAHRGAFAKQYAIFNKAMIAVTAS